MTTMQTTKNNKLKKFTCPSCNYALDVIGTAQVWCKRGHPMRTSAQWAEFEKNRLAREAKKKSQK